MWINVEHLNHKEQLDKDALTAIIQNTHIFRLGLNLITNSDSSNLPNNLNVFAHRSQDSVTSNFSQSFPFTYLALVEERLVLATGGLYSCSTGYYNYRFDYSCNLTDVNSSLICSDNLTSPNLVGTSIISMIYQFVGRNRSVYKCDGNTLKILPWEK